MTYITSSRRHLIPAERLATLTPADATEAIAHRRPGNGLRVHARYIVALSLVTFTLFFGALAALSSRT